MPVDILIPPLSQTMDTLVLVEWLKKPGDAVKKGEMLFTVETDKATLEVESPASGTLYEVYAEPNSEIAVCSVIGKILTEGESAPAVKPTQEKVPIPEQKKSSDAAKKESTPAILVIPSENRVFASPRARRLADLHHLDLAKATPSGPRGMIVERDLQPLHTQRKIGKAAPMSSTRRVISQRMMDSHLGTAPVTYLCEADASELVKYREKLISVVAPVSLRPTYTDLFIRIVCLALRSHPQLNATLEGDTLTLHERAHIALAVDTDRGLIVPVLKGADLLNLGEITRQRSTLVERALAGKCTPDELSGGTFTITNLGIMGIDIFTPIINPPQVAILAIGSIREMPATINGGIYIRQRIGLGVTCDHRAIDGAPAARFLNEVRLLVEGVGSGSLEEKTT